MNPARTTLDSTGKPGRPGFLASEGSRQQRAVGSRGSAGRCTGLSRTGFLIEQVQRVVEEHPGVWVQRAVEILGCEHHASSKTMVQVIRFMTEDGRIVRRAWGGRHWLFPCRPDLEDWWKQVAALRKHDMRRLYELVCDSPSMISKICSNAKRSLGWPASTTQDRLRTLAEAGLLRFEYRGQGQRHAIATAGQIHPSAVLALRYDCAN